MTSSFTMLLYVTIKSKSIVCVRVVRTTDKGPQTDLVTTLLSNNYTHAVQYGIHLTLVPSTQCDMSGPAINTHENCYTYSITADYQVYWAGIFKFNQPIRLLLYS